jgi:anti-sigma B factor antagonist
MMIHLTEREMEGILVIDVTGDLNFGESDLSLQQYVSSTIMRGQTRIVLNLQRVHNVDMFTVGTFRLLAEECRSRGGKLVLLNAPLERLEPSLLLSLETDFEVFDDEQDAINCFFPSRQSHRIDIVKFIQQLRASSHSEQATPS